MAVFHPVSSGMAYFIYLIVVVVVVCFVCFFFVFVFCLFGGGEAEGDKQCLLKGNESLCSSCKNS